MRASAASWTAWKSSTGKPALQHVPRYSPHLKKKTKGRKKDYAFHRQVDEKPSIPPASYPVFLLRAQSRGAKQRCKAAVQSECMPKALLLLLHQLADVSCCLCNAVGNAAGEQHHCQEQLQQS